jgi:predicted metal-binding membrane protein
MPIGIRYAESLRARLRITPLAPMLIGAGWLGLIWLESGARPRALSIWASFARFTLDWHLMVLAMMLPLTIPWLRNRAERGARHELRLLGGFVVVWAVFGLFAYLMVSLLDVLVGRLAWLSLHTWLLAAALVAAGGIAHMKATRRRQDCGPAAAPYREEPEGMLVGWRFGTECLRRCCGLMVAAMFFGSPHLLWITIITIAMLIERPSLLGRRLRMVAGASVVVAAILFVAVPGALAASQQVGTHSKAPTNALLWHCEITH